MQEDLFTIPRSSRGNTSSGVERREAAARSAPPSRSPAWPRQLLAALVFSAVAGVAAGWVFGGATGVRDGAADASRLASTRAAESHSRKTEAEMARLFEEVRGLRAQLEQFRHDVETQRAAEQTCATAARLQDVSTRLERLERSAVDPTPVGSLKKPMNGEAPVRPQKVKAR
jgi:hypothetical protein